MLASGVLGTTVKRFVLESVWPDGRARVRDPEREHEQRGPEPTAHLRK